MKTVTLLYDGECLICTQFSKYLKLRKKHTVHVLNARENLDLVHELMAQGHDINHGMILKYGNEVYVGEEAVNKLDLLIEEQTIRDKLVLKISSTPYIGPLFYKIGKLIRVVVFVFQGKWEKIRFR